MAQEKQKHKARKVSIFRSLQTKILIMLLLVTTATLAGFAVFNLNEARQRLEADLQRLAETTVQRLSQHLIGPLWALNTEQIVDSIEAAMLERRVFAVIVREEDRETKFVGRQRDRDWNVVDAKSNPRGDLILSKTTLLHNNEELIGVLEVYVSRRFLQQQFEAQVRSEIVRAGALDLVLIVVTLALLRGVVVSPIRRVTEAADRIASGQLSTKIDVGTNDEIGALADAVNKLQTSLRIAMERMKKVTRQ